MPEMPPLARALVTSPPYRLGNLVARFTATKAG